MKAKAPNLLLTTLLLASCSAAWLAAYPAVGAEMPAGEAERTAARERAAWDAFAKSLNTEAFAKDFPGPLRDLDAGDNLKAVTALNVLGASGAIEAVPYLVPFLQSPRPEIRVHAGLNLERIVSGIELQRRDPAIPGRVALRPRTAKDPDLTPLRWIVRRMLTAEDDGNTASYGATMAGYIGLLDLEQELRDLLGSRHPAVTRSAVHALRTLDLLVEQEPHPLNATPAAGLVGVAVDERPLLKEYQGAIILPAELYLTYQALVAALETGQREEIEKFCLPNKIAFTTDPRPNDRQYGQDINLPYLKDGFHKFILKLHKDSDTQYLIRTASSAFWFTRTADGKWKLSEYLDKPIK